MESGQGNLSRQPTLEAQPGFVAHSRDMWTRLFRHPQTSDEFEQTIHEKATGRDKALADLLINYGRLKSRAGADILRCLVWYKTFSPLTPRPADACKCDALWAIQTYGSCLTIERKGLEPEALQFHNGKPFSVCVEQLATALRCGPHGHLQLWYLLLYSAFPVPEG